MSHEQDLSMAAAYALDALDELDRARFERHLADCQECREEVAALREGLEEIVGENSIPPPPHLRASVMDQIESIDQIAPVEPRVATPRSQRRLWTAVAAIAAVVVAIGALLVTATDPLDDLLAQTDTRVVAVGGTDTYTGSGSADAVVSGDRERVYLRVENLESPADGSVYAAWLIGESGPEPAGLFVPDADGTATVALDGPVGTGVLLGITVEPEGGSSQPTTDVLFLGDLG